MPALIYHNPRCSKSRATLALLQDRNIDTQIIEYLNDPPDLDTLRAILQKLGRPAADMVRTNEAAFRESGLTKFSEPEELLKLIAAEPKVLERPIVVFGAQARIGRPPEAVLEMFE